MRWYKCRTKKKKKSDGVKTIIAKLKNNEKFVDNKVDLQGKTTSFSGDQLKELCIAYAENNTTTHLDFKMCNIGVYLARYSVSADLEIYACTF
jgi:hypothetical protein